MPLRRLSGKGFAKPYIPYRETFTLQRGASIYSGTVAILDRSIVIQLRTDNVYVAAALTRPCETAIYGCTHAIYAGTDAIYGRTDAIYAGIDAIYARTDAIYGRTDPIYSGTDAIYGGTGAILARAEAIFTGAAPILLSESRPDAGLPTRARETGRL